AIHNHLGGVDAGIPKRIRVIFLAFRPLSARIRVAPAKLVPIIDMLFQHNDFRVPDSLLLVEPRQKRICRRAAGAAFGSKQLNNDWSDRLVGIFRFSTHGIEPTSSEYGTD